MPKADRRALLLETAHDIVREKGTDALSLGALAERGGVSKPIAYSHFETRAGLLIALYKQINDRQVSALESALQQSPSELDFVSRMLSDAYMECHTAVGPEWHAIGAALKGDPQMDAYRQEMTDGHVQFYVDSLTPLLSLSGTVIRRRCVGIVGAAEALSEAMVRGKMSKQEASAELSSLLLSWLSTPKTPLVAEAHQSA